MTQLEDPFAPPAAPLSRALATDRTEALALRQAHLVLEERLKKAGGWLLVIAAALASVALSALGSSALNSGGAPKYFCAALLVFAAVYAAAGASLIALTPGAHVFASLVTYPLFLVVPVGTILAIVICRPLLSVIGQPLLSAQYRAAVEATPDLVTVPWSLAMLIVGPALIGLCAWQAWMF